MVRRSSIIFQAFFLLTFSTYLGGLSPSWRTTEHRRLGVTASFGDTRAKTPVHRYQFRGLPLEPRKPSSVLIWLQLEKLYTHLRGGRVENQFVKATIPECDSELDLLTIGSLIYCKTSAIKCYECFPSSGHDCSSVSGSTPKNCTVESVEKTMALVSGAPRSMLGIDEGSFKCLMIKGVEKSGNSKNVSTSILRSCMLPMPSICNMIEEAVALWTKQPSATKLDWNCVVCDKDGCNSSSLLAASFPAVLRRRPSRLPVDANSQPGPYTEPQLGSSTAPSSAPLTFTRPCDEETWQRLSPDCTYEEYIAADDDITVWGTLDNADIIREQQESSNEEGEEEMEEEPEDIPTTKDVLKAWTSTQEHLSARALAKSCGSSSII
uniref:Uncharacterized protein n=1 Tax=Timema bartmani TaxID=61472 RepID=A0A7R9ETF7_9NEOP|nr:unnamed protein product [Timema bartmani]